MTFDEYQIEASKTAVYPKVGENFVYPVLGLAGESGEVVEKVKKVFRDKNGIVDDETRDSIKKELGDVLWYLAQISTELNISFSDVVATNIEKLKSRAERDKLHGDGDNR